MCLFIFFQYILDCKPLEGKVHALFFIVIPYNALHIRSKYLLDEWMEYKLSPCNEFLLNIWMNYKNSHNFEYCLLVLKFA